MSKKKGFTLAELCIVIALLLIVVTMVVTFVISYRRNAYSLQNNREIMADIATVQDQVKSWIRAYDHQDITITASGDAIQAGGDSLSFSDGTLSVTAGGTEETVSVPNITGCDFQWEDNMISCTVRFRGDQTQKLLFSVFTQTKRDRYSSGEREKK